MAWTLKEGSPPESGGHIATPWLRGVALPVYSEEATNDSDKSFAVDTDGNGHPLRILGIRIEFTATATVGTRTFTIELQDEDSDVISSILLSTNSDVTASSSKTIEVAPQLVSSVVGTVAQEPLQDHYWIRAGQTLRIFDSAAIDPTADDMVVHLRTSRF